MQETISEEEKIVYELIHDYLKKRRPIEVDKIIPYILSNLAKKSIDMNSKKIKLIVKSFLKKKLIVEGSRLTKDEILENDMRKKIYEFISENSAVYFHQIMKQLNLPSHSIIWHLNLLYLFGFIKRIKIKKHYNHYIYYNNNITEQQARKIYFMKNVKCREIIDYLKNENEGCTKTHLSKQLEMHPNTITKYINALEAIEVVYKESFSNKSLYFLTQK